MRAPPVTTGSPLLPDADPPQRSLVWDPTLGEPPAAVTPSPPLMGEAGPRVRASGDQRRGIKDGLESPARHGRDRVTVDLRGLGGRLQACAAARGISSAALVRQSLAPLLHDAPAGGDASQVGAAPAHDGTLVKVTLRLPAAHAALLARQARAADVSQGAYVADLLEGMPRGPLAPDHAEAIATLARSTDRLAALSTDLNAFMRLLGRLPGSELARYRAGLRTLVDDVRQHLGVAAALVAELKPGRGRRW
jgi:hypothetical protein